MNDEQLTVLKRVTFLLSSAQILIHDAYARRIANEAILQALKVIEEAEHERTGQHQQLR